MSITQQQRSQGISALELGVRSPHREAEGVVDSLSAGMACVRDLLLKRIHEDVERNLGIDSLTAPISQLHEQRQTQSAKLEIDMYSTIVVAEEVTEGGYVDHPREWFLNWLFQLRLKREQEPLFQQRVRSYKSPSAEARRLKFLAHLQRAMPESARSPLVLFRLIPRALRIVGVVAFGDPLRAQELRAEQCSFLPAIGDCPECHGRVLDNDESCHICGNPVWEFEWLTSE